MRAGGGVITVGKVRNVVSPQNALLPKGTFPFTVYNVTFGKSKMADVDIAFVRILVNRPHRSHLSTLKLYLVAKYIKVRYTKPKELWLPTCRLIFESWSPAW